MKRPHPPTVNDEDDNLIPKKQKETLLQLSTLCIRIPLNITADLPSIVRSQRTQTELRQRMMRKRKRVRVSDGDSDGDPKDLKDGKEIDDKDDVSSKDEDDGSQELGGNDDHDGMMPHRGDYSNVLDYLEAKYVRGVNVDSGDSGANDEHDKANENDAGSYYSDADNSFLDDSELVTTLAEQVLAGAAKTKVEMNAKKEREDLDESSDDDAAFFVNMGDIEIAEDEDDPTENSWFINAHEEYEKEKLRLAKKGGSKKKRKPKDLVLPSSGPSGSSSSKVSTQSKSLPKKEAIKPPQKNCTKSNEELERLRSKVDELKGEVDNLVEASRRAIADLTEDHLPRISTTFKAVIDMPDNLEPGESFQFVNPRIPGQKLQANIPEVIPDNRKITVFCPCPEGETSTEDMEGKTNKLPKEFRELLDVYSKVYDEWVCARCDFADAHPDEKPLKPYNERSKKFIKIISFFPSNLAMPIDSRYIQSRIKQLRQNRHKKNKVLAENGREHDMEILKKEDFLLSDFPKNNAYKKSNTNTTCGEDIDEEDAEHLSAEDNEDEEDVLVKEDESSQNSVDVATEEATYQQSLAGPEKDALIEHIYISTPNLCTHFDSSVSFNIEDFARSNSK